MLDCTDPNQRILENIDFVPNLFPKEKPAFKSLSGSIEADNTIVLLDAVYNGTTLLKRMEADSLRRTLLREIKSFQDLLIQFYEEPNKMGENERSMVRDRILKHLEAASPFAAFKRCIIRRLGLVEEMTA